MALLEQLPTGPGVTRWPLWSTTARLVVTDPDALPAARRIVEQRTGEVERACSRFRPDSELARLPADGRPVRVGPLLAELVAVALRAAARTGGTVDPTLGAALAAAGYDRDIRAVTDAPLLRPVTGPGWSQVRLDGSTLSVPAGVRLDLGATAKAWTADRCAADVADDCGAGVLVALGGDVATAGPGDWPVLVQDGPAEPPASVLLDAGSALATSSTISRTWRRGATTAHHVLDPRTGSCADPVWRTVSVVAGSCEDANTLSTAAVVRGLDGWAWLRSLGVPARLVGATGTVVTTGGWPS
jgi:thiamine biosynthesis lipoprotein